MTNFLLLDLATAGTRGGRLARADGPGLVPRTFGHGHPLAHCLRVTVRDPDEDDRLIEAVQAITPTLPPLPDEVPA